MYPYFKSDLDKGAITREFAQELIDCVWVKLNDLNKCRDCVSAEGFAGYSLFQNLIVGGQDIYGLDATNDLSFMCITATEHVFLPQPSFSVRVLGVMIPNASAGQPNIRVSKFITADMVDFPSHPEADAHIEKQISEYATVSGLQDLAKYCVEQDESMQVLCESFEFTPDEIYGITENASIIVTPKDNSRILVPLRSDIRREALSILRGMK